MIDIAFNELSLSQKVESKAHCRAIFDAFFKIADSITALKIDTVRIRTSCDFYIVNFCDEFYTIKDWLKEQNNDDRARYLGYYVQDFFITDNPYYSFNNENANGFGFAYEYDTTSLSLNNQIWGEDEYIILREFLSDGEADVQQDEVISKHCPVPKIHETVVLMLKKFNENQNFQLKSSLKTIKDFWNKREEIFPNLIFTKNVENLLEHYGSLKNPDLKKAINFLYRIEEHLKRYKRGEVDYGSLPADVSNEGEATLNKHGYLRTFELPNGDLKIFSLHAKPGNTVRVHLYPNQKEAKYYIGYIGPHLETATS